MPRTPHDLWNTRPNEMTAAVGRLQHALSEALLEHDGVRPEDQGDRDSFVVAFARASDAVACALQLQRASLAPIHLRIGLHTSEVQSARREYYADPTVTRDRAPARFGARWPDRVITSDGGDARRPAPRGAWLRIWVLTGYKVCRVRRRLHSFATLTCITNFPHCIPPMMLPPMAFRCS